MNFKKLIKKIKSIKIKEVLKVSKSYKNVILIGIGKKFLDFIYLFIVFCGISSFYYFFTGVNHSTFTNVQIDEFIKKEIPIGINFVSEKYLIDLKGYGEKDLVIIIRPREKYKVTDYNQENWTDKIFIFSKVQKNPIQKLLFDGNIFKKDFSFEFKFHTFFKDKEKLSDKEELEINNSYNEYNLAKANIYLKDIFPIRRKSTFSSKSDLIINGISYHNGGNNEFYYGILSYNFGKYTIKPLINLSYGEDGINCDNSNVNKIFCLNGIRNYSINAYINNNLENISFSHLVEWPGYIDFLDDYTLFYAYLHSTDCDETSYYGLPNQCSYYKYGCELGEVGFNCYQLSTIKRLSENHNKLVKKIEMNLNGFYGE